ncbi:MAG TPA: hypothetical protein VIL85_07855 [Thermomicrobiales bacterium]|jgi:hypothetical protein
MESPLDTLRSALANLYLLRANALRYLDTPLSPLIQQRWRGRLARLEDAICASEARIATIEARYLYAQDGQPDPSRRAPS